MRIPPPLQVMTLMETSGFFILERIEPARMSDKIKKTAFEQSEEGSLLAPDTQKGS